MHTNLCAAGSDGQSTQGCIPTGLFWDVAPDVQHGAKQHRDDYGYNNNHDGQRSYPGIAPAG
jgi:hypothetical protein